jgi:hypothetical protein
MHSEFRKKNKDSVVRPEKCTRNCGAPTPPRSEVFALSFDRRDRSAGRAECASYGLRDAMLTNATQTSDDIEISAAFPAA